MVLVNPTAIPISALQAARRGPAVQGEPEGPRRTFGVLGGCRGLFEGEKEICTETLSVICSAMCSPIEQHSERGGTNEAVPPAPEPRRPQRQPCAAQAVVPPASAAGCCVDCAGGHCPPCSSSRLHGCPAPTPHHPIASARC